MLVIDQEEPKLVSIIIVLYNSAEYIEKCIQSIGRLDYNPIEIILVDNASRDESVSVARRTLEECRIEHYHLIQLGRNAGFAAANNRGFELSSGEILFLLNPDTELYPDTLRELVRAFRDPSVGICGSKVYYPDGKTLQHAGGFVRDNGLAMHYGYAEEDKGQYDTLREVGYVTGAALSVRRDVFREAGGFDEGYHPAYFEETDLCLRVRRMGYKVVYVPTARVIHYESTTVGKFSERYLYLFHKNRIRFMLKNYSWHFLWNRALPMEEKWIGMIAPEEQAIPLNKAYIANIFKLPGTLLARRRMEEKLRAPRIEDNVSSLE
ncbi:MAG: glycosyltransferase family 2 protein [Actinomycetota bacterium]|nr:glycosyltransferase family 2 protein [Actinomycetota bacterium]